MNPRASDRVRGFQDTIITVEDIRFTVIVGATLGAEIIITSDKTIIKIYLLSSLVKRVTLLMLPGPAKFTGVTLTL